MQFMGTAEEQAILVTALTSRAILLRHRAEKLTGEQREELIARHEAEIAAVERLCQEAKTGMLVVPAAVKANGG